MPEYGKQPPTVAAGDPKLKQPLPKGPAGIVAMGLLLLGLLWPSEGGRRLDIYLDSVKIPTACTGIIGPEVTARWKAAQAITDPEQRRLKARFTDAECEAMEVAYVSKQLTAMQACVPKKVLDEFTVGEFLAHAHWAYNTGTGAYCGNTGIHRALMRGDHVLACRSMAAWTFVTLNGQKVNCRLQRYQKLCGGIPKRRDAEVQMCLDAL